MTEKLGPCPLCGGKPSLRIPGYAACLDDRCPMPQANADAWSRLSAIAVSEKRMRAALEDAIDFIDCVGIEDACMGDERIKVLGRCREALKGGEG